MRLVRPLRRERLERREVSPRPHKRYRVDGYLRESLCIHKSVKALALCCSVTWDGVLKFRNRVRDESSLWSW